MFFLQSRPQRIFSLIRGKQKRGFLNCSGDEVGFSRLKPNITKCKIAGVGPLKEVPEAVCGLKTVESTNEAIKMLGIHFSHHNETKAAEFFKHMKINRGCQCMEYKKLTLGRSILIFLKLGVSKIVYLSLFIYSKFDI